MQWSFRQLFDISKFIIQNGINTFGPGLFNENLFAISKRNLNEQVATFPLEMPQLNKNSTFNLNWRLTADPSIHDHSLDLSFFFDIGPEQSHCLEADDMHDYYFQDKYNEKYLQFILSDRVPNCMMAAMERLDWFDYMITSDFLRAHFGSAGVKINAQFFQDAYPAIRERFGGD